MEERLYNNKQYTIRVYENPGITRWHLGNHFAFCNIEGSGDPYFTSPHVNILDENDASRAYARLKILLQLVSGIRVLHGKEKIISPKSLNYYNGYRYDTPSWEEDIDIMFDELSNPFDSEVCEYYKDKKGYYSSEFDEDVINLLISDSLVREVIILLAMSQEEIVYFLVNTYKIIENIKSDLSLGSNNSKLIKSKNSKDLPEFLLTSLNEIYQYSQYMNSRDASGILSRHGVTKIPIPSKIPTLKEIKVSLTNAINDWLNYKCMTKFNRKYKNVGTQ